MTHFQLTEEQAKILDDVIQFMFDSNVRDNRDLSFSAIDYQSDRHIRKLKHVTEEDMVTMLSIADIYLKDSPFYPFVGDISDLRLAKAATAFRNYGGFSKIYEIENRKDVRDEELRSSTVKTGKWTRRNMVISGILAATTTLVVLTNYFDNKAKKLQQDIKEKSDSLRQSETRQDVQELTKQLHQISQSLQDTSKVKVKIEK